MERLEISQSAAYGEMAKRVHRDPTTGHTFLKGRRAARRVEAVQDTTDRKQPEEGLPESSKRFRVLTDNIDAGVALIDEDGNFSIVNPAFLRLFDLPSGTDIKNVNDRDWGQWQVFDESGSLLDVDEHPVRKAVIMGKPVRDKLVGVRPPSGGSLKWILISAESILKRDGSVDAVICTYHDVTDRKRNEEALRESELRFRSLFENMLDGYAYCRMEYDETGRPVDFVYLHVNEAFERLTGLSNVVDKRVTEVIPAIRELEPDLLEIYGRVAATGHSEQFEIFFKPLRAWLSVLAYSPQYGYFVAVFENITDRKRAEERLASDLKALTRMHALSTKLLDAEGTGPLMQEIMDAAVGVVGADKGTLQLLEGNTLRIAAHHGHEPPFLDFLAAAGDMASVCGAYTKERRRVVVEDVEQSDLIAGTPLLNVLRGAGVRAIQSTPLVSRDGKLLGILTTHWSGAYSPDEHDLWRLDLLARQAAELIERKRAEQALSDSEAKFKLLAQTAEKLLRSSDPQAVVDDLCREAMKILDCQAFFNFLVDEPTNRLRLNACAGIPEKQARQIEWLDYGVAVCGCVAQSGERIIAEDIQRSSDIKTELIRSFGIQAYCCHPLKTHDRLIGTLSFGTRTRSRFAESEIEIMRIIADQVSVAMQRIQAERSLRELNASLEQRVEERTVEITNLASQLRELASELTMTEQRERQRLAKVLHDDVQQMLVAAKLQTAVLVNRQSNENLAASVRLVNDLLDQTLSAARTLTSELSPPILYDGGLGPALQWLARSFLEKHGLKIEIAFDPAGEPQVEDVRIFLFDAVREILFNVVKHAGAKEAHVEGFRDSDGRIRIVVSDNGKGFDPAGLRGGGKSEGFGLFSINQRLKHFGGRFDIRSDPAQGTRITLIGPPPPETKHERMPPDHTPSIGPAEEPLISEKIRLVLADDHHIIRQGLAGLLRMEPDMEVVGEASDGAQAVSLSRSLRPDVVVMDVSMPGTNGIDATREIRRDFPGIQVVGLSMHEEGELSAAMREAGAAAYVTKGGPPEALIKAIHEACSLPSNQPLQSRAKDAV